MKSKTNIILYLVAGIFAVAASVAGSAAHAAGIEQGTCDVTFTQAGAVRVSGCAGTSGMLSVESGSRDATGPLRTARGKADLHSGQTYRLLRRVATAPGGEVMVLVTYN